MLHLLILVAFFWGTSSPIMKRYSANDASSQPKTKSPFQHIFSLFRRYDIHYIPIFCYIFKVEVWLCISIWPSGFHVVLLCSGTIRFINSSSDCKWSHVCLCRIDWSSCWQAIPIKSNNRGFYVNPNRCLHCIFLETITFRVLVYQYIYIVPR